MRWLRSTFAVAEVAVVDVVGLEADDRLDAVLLGRLHELHRAVHDAVVGEADGGLAERRRAGGQRVDLAGAVQERVLRVDVEVCAAGGAHSGRAKSRGGVGWLRASRARLFAGFAQSAPRAGPLGEARAGAGRRVSSPSVRRPGASPATRARKASAAERDQAGVGLGVAAALGRRQAAAVVGDEEERAVVDRELDAPLLALGPGGPDRVG